MGNLGNPGSLILGHRSGFLSNSGSLRPDDLLSPSPTMAAPRLLRTRPALIPLSRTLASSLSPPPLDPVKHVAALIKKDDPHAYQASYFFPPGRPREAFLAYRALNVRIPSSLSEDFVPLLALFDC